MSKKFNWSKTYPVSADTLMNILTSEEFETRNMESQPSNKEGSYTVVSKDSNKLVYRMDTVEWAKTKTGGLDKSKTENTSTTTTWDLKSRRADWNYKGAHEKAKVNGKVEITPKGDKAELSTEFNVDIGIPVVGGQIEKIVISEVKKHWPTYEALVDEFVKKES